ncbi:ATP-binding cassette domain-containing protein [Methanoplanus limicola]|uniref:Daunorubicin resistance ABC transporter ATPase subunit n=1 Tax=Methanoplanus limicola DSM 2279 TaxID=937775 RepID=H1Z248_9EURY|nr:ATP-binding cassette domain-containing protein [Methanoplanus limicola]EHQ36393.1 daunorubicin resistance ABC transporter ATPase subunit [Methanoplanus limicola DSM 2279]
MNSIELKEITKIFGDLTAVDNVSFSVKKGELFGLLGPNGAGKTTIINMLTTLLLPTSGKAEIEGYDIVKKPDDVRRNIGIIFQEPSLDIGLTGWENLEFHAMMYSINADERKRRIKEVLEVVGLTEKAGVLVEYYSGGMKRRLEIARGLIHHPKVLFLDEPTLGLDAQTRRKIWDYIKDLNNKYDLSIILTTHYMEEADYLCERIAIIDNGKIISLDSPESLKNQLEGDIITLKIPGEKVTFLRALEEKIKIKDLTQKGDTVLLTITEGENKIPELFLLAQKMGVEINSVNLRKPSLEDVFIHLTGSGIREEEGSRHAHIHAGMRRRMMR